MSSPERRPPSNADTDATANEPAQAGQKVEPSSGGQAVRRTATKISLKRVPPPNPSFHPDYEVGWDGPEDRDNPLNWSRGKQWAAVYMGGSLIFNSTLASSAPSVNIPQYMRAFGVSEVAASLTITTFLCGYLVGPLVLGPLSETFGRRNIFVYSFFPYIGFSLGCALSKNIGSLIVFRYLAGSFASSPVANSGAVVGDVLPPHLRGLGMGMFALAPLAGPSLGPLVGGYIEVSGTSWRWTYYALTIFAGVNWLLIAIFFPETYAPYILQQRAKRLRKETGIDGYWAPLDRRSRTAKDLLKYCLVRPFKMLWEEPMLMALTVYISYVYALLYSAFSSVPIIISEIHGYSAGVVGLSFLPVFIGGALGVLLYAVFFNPRYVAEARRIAPAPVPPERRLILPMIGGIIFPISIYWLCWSGNYKSVSIWSPLFAMGAFGFSFFCVFVGLLSFIVDTYLMFSASALAINTVVRSATAAAFPLFTPAAFHNLGVGWAGTLFGSLALVCAPIPFIFNVYGPQIRAMSKNAPKRPPGGGPPQPPSQPPPQQEKDAGPEERDVEAQRPSHETAPEEPTEATGPGEGPGSTV